MDNIILKQGDVLAYKGDKNSPISNIVKIMTKSQYSHLCLYISDDNAIEADGIKGDIDYVNINNYKGRLDVYTCPSLTDLQRKQICDYAISRIGQKYDYGLLFFLFLKRLFKFRFRLRDRKTDICSELVNDSYTKCGCKLVKKKYPSPQEVISSDLLKFNGSY